MSWRDRGDDLRIDLTRIRRRADKKQDGSSALGIASLGISAVCALAIFALFVFAVAINVRQNGVVNDRDPVIVMVGFGVIGTMLLAVVGIVLGAVGAFQSNPTGVLCSIIGVVINSMILLGIIALMCLGTMAPH